MCLKTDEYNSQFSLVQSANLIPLLTTAVGNIYIVCLFVISETGY